MARLRGASTVDVLIVIFAVAGIVSFLSFRYDASASVPPQVEWQKSLGSGWGAYSVTETPDGGCAVAGMYGSLLPTLDGFLLKTDIYGNVQWNKTYGGNQEDRLFCVINTRDQGYAMVGLTFSFGQGYEDFWFVKTDAVGNQQWSKTYGGTGFDEAHSIVETNDGGYAIAGYSQTGGLGTNYQAMLVKTDQSGNVEWSRTYGNSSYAYSVIQTSDGGYALACSGDLSLVKTDSNGNMQWNFTYSSQSYFYSVVQTSGGGYALCGRTYWGSYSHFLLMKVGAVGGQEWNETYSRLSGTEAAYSMVQTKDGGLALVGSSWPQGASGDSFWLVYTDENGNMQWDQVYSYYGICQCIVQTEDMGFVLVGGSYIIKTSGLSVAVNPMSVTMDVGQSVIFTSNVSGGHSPYTYQWVLDLNTVLGATGQNWAFVPTQSGFCTVYVNVTDSVGITVQSYSAVVTVNPTLLVSISPESTKLDLSKPQLFTSNVSGGTPPYVYQWFLNNSLVVGANSSSLVFSSPTRGYYQVFLNVTDSASVRVQSNTAYATVGDIVPPTIWEAYRIPSGNVTDNEIVQVFANVTDTESGVKNVTVSFTTSNGTSWTDVVMDYNLTNNLWNGTITGQPFGTWVKFKVIAYDNAENYAVREESAVFVYQVIPEFSSLFILLLFIVTTLSAVVVYKRESNNREKGCHITTYEA